MSDFEIILFSLNFFSALICQGDQTTQYLIYTSEELKDAGILLSNFYNNPEKILRYIEKK